MAVALGLNKYHATPPARETPLQFRERRNRERTYLVNEGITGKSKNLLTSVSIGDVRTRQEFEHSNGQELDAANRRARAPFHHMARIQ